MKYLLGRENLGGRSAVDAVFLPLGQRFEVLAVVAQQG
jgi:hypothetical protein